ncbi:MAG: UbiX family flavin prenyltransferase, partial [Chloroflexi bacterium]|nr:UbiX family flavin prenyltransferase [Chloroflexota bacterium]
MDKRRLVVGISGSSGSLLGIRFLEALKQVGVESHLVLTSSAHITIHQETHYTASQVMALADYSYSPKDIGAAIASGSFPTLGMVIIPCSIKSLSAVANSYADNLLQRAADVTLKEGRPLLLVVRETPLHPGHVRLMELAAAAGAILFPPVPAFYTRPASLDDVVDNLVGRVLARLGIENAWYHTWSGVSAPPTGEDATRAALLALPALTLATVGRDGRPHTAAVFFVAGVGSRLYFYAAPDGALARDVQADPHAAVSLLAQTRRPAEAQTLSLRGTVHAVSPGAEASEAEARYRAKFPFAPPPAGET